VAVMRQSLPPNKQEERPDYKPLDTASAPSARDGQHDDMASFSVCPGGGDRIHWGAGPLENTDGVHFTVSSPDDKRSQDNRQRPFIGLRWECCGLYTRVYRHLDGTHYPGRCPGCSKSVRIEVGSGGTSSRFFSVR